MLVEEGMMITVNKNTIVLLQKPRSYIGKLHNISSRGEPLKVLHAVWECKTIYATIQGYQCYFIRLLYYYTVTIYA